MLDKKTIDRLKEKLKAAKNELAATVKRLNEPQEFGSDTDSFEEEAEEAEQFSADAGKAKLVHDRLHRVEKALLKIENGSYGKCEKCGGEIDIEVLEIDPESEVCRRCKLAMNG